MDTLKRCTVCGVEYGPGTRNSTQYAKSKFCSLKCTGKTQQNSIDDILSRCKRSETGCLVWQGPTNTGGNKRGYARTNLKGKRKLVHVATWEHYYGKVPRGLQLDHTCANKICCEVKHLRVVTAQQNILAPTCNNMANRWARRTECEKCGGPFSTFPNGIRFCKPCRNAKMMAAQRIRRAAAKNSPNPTGREPSGTNEKEINT